MMSDGWFALLRCKNAHLLFIKYIYNHRKHVFSEYVYFEISCCIDVSCLASQTCAYYALTCTNIERCQTSFSLIFSCSTSGCNLWLAIIYMSYCSFGSIIWVWLSTAGGGLVGPLPKDRFCMRGWLGQKQSQLRTSRAEQWTSVSLFFSSTVCRSRIHRRELGATLHVWIIVISIYRGTCTSEASLCLAKSKLRVHICHWLWTRN